MKIPFVISKRGKLERKQVIILKSRQVGATTMYSALLQHYNWEIFQ